MNEFDKPVDCPACGATSGRALTVPALLGFRHSGTKAQSAESSAGSAVKGGSADSGYVRLVHGAACKCCA